MPSKKCKQCGQVSYRARDLTVTKNMYCPYCVEKPEGINSRFWLWLKSTGKEDSEEGSGNEFIHWVHLKWEEFGEEGGDPKDHAAFDKWLKNKVAEEVGI